MAASSTYKFVSSQRSRQDMTWELPLLVMFPLISRLLMFAIKLKLLLGRTKLVFCLHWSLYRMSTSSFFLYIYIHIILLTTAIGRTDHKWTTVLRSGETIRSLRWCVCSAGAQQQRAIASVLHSSVAEYVCMFVAATRGHSGRRNTTVAALRFVERCLECFCE